MNLHVVGFIPPVIAAEYGIGQTTVSKIKRGVIWREE